MGEGDRVSGGRGFFMDTPLWGVRVQAPFGARVQKVQKVQRVVVGRL